MKMRQHLFILLVGKCLAHSSISRLDQCCNSSVLKSPSPEMATMVAIAANRTTPNRDQTDWNSDDSIGGDGIDASEARARLALVIPVMYGLGTITTMLVFVTVIVFKGLAVTFVTFCFYMGDRLGFQFQPYPVLPPPPIRRPLYININKPGFRKNWHFPKYKFFVNRRPAFGNPCGKWGCSKIGSDHSPDEQPYDDEDHYSHGSATEEE